MAFVPGNQLGKQILDALGVDAKTVHSLDIHCAVNDVATATLVTYVKAEGTDNLIEVLTHYRLVEDTDATQPTP